MDINSYLSRIASADAAALDALEHELFGRKAGVMTEQLKTLKDLGDEERRARGEELNASKRLLEQAIASRRNALSASHFDALKGSDWLDVTLDPPEGERGHLHPIHEFMRQVEEVFGRMGFDVAYGPEIETEENNFDLLNIPATHAARDAQDTFWVGDHTVLRTHTSPVQIRYMKSHKPPFRMICPGKVYRKDSDATHSPMFHQFEGLMIDKDISLANLKAVLITALKELISPDIEFRFRTGYFPFVEPGLEMDMRWQGDMKDSREGAWLEMGGCGMVHPNVLKNVGIDPKKWQGFAFGFGVERPLMIKHRIPDLRVFFSGDTRFLKQF